MLETIVIPFCALLLTALGITTGFIIRTLKNGKAINPNPSLLPGDDRLFKTGDMAVAYWQLKFDNLESEIKLGNEKLDTIISLLKKT